jgi:hypothetical protein
MLLAPRRWRFPVPALPDLQAGIRHALVTGEADAIAPLLRGGRDSRLRLAIHQRQYATSLVTALLDRFPATVWLVGSDLVTAAARRFVQLNPPTRPCIAEYGEGFPAFMSSGQLATEVPYLGQFAELEWHLGRLSLAVDGRALTPADLQASDAEALAGSSVVMQPGTHYVRADWAVDELISLYLADNAPDQFSLQLGDVWLELRGARGKLRMNRLTRAVWTFRAALAAWRPLGDAAVEALEIDAAFDPGRAFLDLIADSLLVRIVPHSPTPKTQLPRTSNDLGIGSCGRLRAEGASASLAVALAKARVGS